MRYEVLEVSSFNPKDIIKALEEYGLRWEVANDDCMIHIIKYSISGKELLNKANMKLKEDYSGFEVICK